MDLGSNVSAVVTGGASGLGEASARRLASRGVKVGIFDMDTERGPIVAVEIGGVYCHVDVSSEESVDKGLAKACAAHGQERILVNCAGIGGGAKTVSRDKETGAAREYPMEKLERVVQVNLIGAFRCITKSAAGMLSLDICADGYRGVIINTASVAAEEGQIGQVAYAASKAGLVGLTLPVARDLASEAIRINTILPGLFDTPLLARLPEEVRGSLAKQVPHPRRLGRAAEFAQFVEMIVSSSYLNGEDIRLDGAIRMGPPSGLT